MSTQNTQTTTKHFLDSVVEEESIIIIPTNSAEEDEIEEEIQRKLIDDELTDEEKEALESEREELLRQQEEGKDPIIEEEEDTEFSYQPFVQELVDNNIIPASAIEGKEFNDNIEGFREVLDTGITAKFNEYKETLINPVSAKFLEFLESGGTPDEFIQVSSGIPDYANLDIEDETTAENIVADNLRLQGYDNEDIIAQIDEYKELGTISKHAKIAQKVLVKATEKQLEELTNNQKLAEQQRIKALEDEREYLKKSIYESENIAGFKPTKSERDKFYEYLTKPIPTTKGNFTTKYLQDLEEEDKIKTAYFKFKKFNFSDIETKIETKKANELQMQLRKKGDKLTSKNNIQEQEEVLTTKLPSMPWLS